MSWGIWESLENGFLQCTTQLHSEGGALRDHIEHKARLMALPLRALNFSN